MCVCTRACEQVCTGKIGAVAGVLVGLGGSERFVCRFLV